MYVILLQDAETERGDPFGRPLRLRLGLELELESESELDLVAR
jgi:hypothetical protein